MMYKSTYPVNHSLKEAAIDYESITQIQLVNYLVATEVEVSLLLKFSEQKVEVEGKVRNLK